MRLISPLRPFRSTPCRNFAIPHAPREPRDQEERPWKSSTEGANRIDEEGTGTARRLRRPDLSDFGRRRDLRWTCSTARTRRRAGRSVRSAPARRARAIDVLVLDYFPARSSAIQPRTSSIASASATTVPERRHLRHRAARLHPVHERAALGAPGAIRRDSPGSIPGTA